jgi:hypothetical protein
MNLSDNRINKLLFATQGVGAIFVAVFLAAYLGGLPTTNVLHSELALKIPLIIFGATLLALLLSALILSLSQKKATNSQVQ